MLKTKDNQIELCGYDLELGITTVIPANIEEAGQIVLSARLFGDIVRRLPDDVVSISADEKLMTNIKSGLSDFSIVAIPASEYPELPAVTGAVGVKLPEGCCAA